jgi:hypothetical protein
MDLASMARLANASRAPLGRVGEILDQIYINEQMRWRKAEADRLTFQMAMTVDEMQAKHPSFSLCLCVALHATEAQENPTQIANLLMRPLRCTQARTSGRCRGVPHRFATLSQCPLHHPEVPSQEAQKRQLAVERKAAELAQKRQLAVEREDAEYAEVLARNQQNARNRQRDLDDDLQARQLAKTNSAQKRQLAKTREAAEYAQKMQLEKEEAQLKKEVAQVARDGRYECIRIAHEKETTRFQLRMSNIHAEIRLSVAKGTMSQEDADAVIGIQRKRLFLSLTAILEKENLTEVKKGYSNFEQLFRQAYLDGFFSPKPLTDWVEGVVDVKKRSVVWYDKDLPKIREKGRLLIAKLEAAKKENLRGQSQLPFLAARKDSPASSSGSGVTSA